MINHNGKEYEKEYIYIKHQVTLLYSRNEHNTVTQPHFSKNLKSSVKLKTQNSNPKKKKNHKHLGQENEKRHELPISEMRILTPPQVLQTTWKSG